MIEIFSSALCTQTPWLCYSSTKDMEKRCCKLRPYTRTVECCKINKPTAGHEAPKWSGGCKWPITHFGTKSEDSRSKVSTETYENMIWTYTFAQRKPAIKYTIFCDVTIYKLPQFRRRFGGTYYVHLQIKQAELFAWLAFLQNAGELVADYMASHPRIKYVYVSQQPLSELQIQFCHPFKKSDYYVDHVI